MKKKNYLAVFIATVMTVLLCCFALVGCGYCQHKLTELVKEPSTCIKQGVRTAYKCEKCGKMFGYSDEKGLYVIKEREKAPLGNHTVGPNSKFVFSDGDAFANMSVSSECVDCGNDFVVDKEGLIPFTPSANGGVASAKHVRDGHYPATEFTFAAGTKSGDKHVIKPLEDSKTDARANVNVPFEANVSRYLIVLVYNSSDKDVEITYGAECYGQYCTSSQITVPARGYASACVDICFSMDQPRSFHELSMMTDLDRAVTLRILGYYYSNEKVQSVELTTRGRTDYMLGEKLDTDGITLTASYGNGVSKILTPDEYTINLADKELTAEDTQVVITYKKMTFTYNIIVRNYTRGQNLALGKTATASEDGFNPTQFGLERLTDGKFDNFNAWGSAAHSSAKTEVWVQIDLGENLAFDNVVLYARHDGCYFPRAYYVEISEDGEHFTKVFEQELDLESTSFGTTPRNILFDTVTARYVRIVATELTNSTGGSYYLEFSEIEVYKTTEVK